MLRPALIFLFSMLIHQLVTAQVVFTIQQNKYPKDSLPEIIIGNYMDVLPEKINASTLEYVFTPTQPEYLFIVADKQSRWITRLWITPEMKHAGLLIDYSTHTVKPEKINEWDVITQQVFDLQDSKHPSEADSVIASYASRHLDSYFSLWLLRFMANKKQQLTLLNHLSANVKTYPEYSQTIASLTAREYPKPGDTFREFSLTDQNNQIFNTTSIRYKWILLNFWSNSCGPCVKEMDDFVKLYKSIDTSKIEFISIALDEDKSEWKTAAASNKIIWPSLWAADNVYCALCLHYNVYAMPFFMLFDTDRKLVFIKDGSDELEGIGEVLKGIKE